MRKSKKVTEANLATILGYVKKAIRSKKMIAFTELRVKTLKRATRRVNSNMAIFQGFSLSNKAVIVKREMYPSAFPKPFIAVYTQDGSLVIIDVEDRVDIKADQIMIKKGFLW